MKSPKSLADLYAQLVIEFQKRDKIISRMKGKITKLENANKKKKE